MAAPRKVNAIVTGLERYRDNITLYRLKPQIQVRFKPGQFLHLALDSYDPSYNWPESRVFSIANAPGKDYIDILVSPKGSFTNRIINEIYVGRQVWIKFPFGSFNFSASTGKDIVLIAGGTGISPFISFLEDSMKDPAAYNSIHLFYGVRHNELILFEEKLVEFSQRNREFRYTIYCEQTNRDMSAGLNKGILPSGPLIDQISLLPDPVYYLSGPKSMIECFENELNYRSVQTERIFYDKWE